MHRYGRSGASLFLVARAGKSVFFLAPVNVRAFLAFIAGAGLIVEAGHGQDVTVGRSIWVSGEPKPEEVPAVPLEVEKTYPGEIKDFDRIAYVIAEQFIDDTGELASMQVCASDMELRSVLTALKWAGRRGPSPRVTPARHAGVAVSGLIGTPIYFNPRSASISDPDATPRLIAASAILVDHKLFLNSIAEPMSAEINAADMPELKRVPVSLQIDASGHVSASAVQSNEDALFSKQISEAVSDWRFTPARKAGLAVASSVLMNVVIQDALALEFRPPSILTRVDPKYPPEAVKSGASARVMIDLDVSTEGDVKYPFIIESNDPHATSLRCIVSIPLLWARL